MICITLTTDFGLEDAYVGVMKGVIFSICPQVEIIDLTHEIPPQDVKKAAFVIKGAYHFFPKGTIHVVVVDPGVGSERRPLVVQTPDYFFVAPDNGVLELVYQQEQKIKVYHLNNPCFFRATISHTFHGRDIFAPVAAHLAKGISPQEMGVKISDYLRLPWPHPKMKNGKLEGEVVYIDHFGNLITNISKEDYAIFLSKKSLQEEIRVWIKGICLNRISSHYLAVSPGNLLALWDSSDYLEIACCMGNAKQKLMVQVGEPVVIEVLGDTQHQTQNL